MEKDEVLKKLKNDIKRLERRKESAINFGWQGKEQVCNYELDFLKSIYQLIFEKK